MADSHYVSYADILNDPIKFKRSAGVAKLNMNAWLDEPGRKFFKIFFHFQNGDIDNPGQVSSSGGLLSPIFAAGASGNKSDWTDEEYRNYTTAWTYLKLNGEDERAVMLEKFVYLLSNISSDFPWYFQTVEGLGAVLERRNMAGLKGFNITDEPYKITIKCLKDSVDDRIGTLLDLYRGLSYSWMNKRWILPGNLRRFDMSIIVFEKPIAELHSRALEYRTEVSGDEPGTKKALVDSEMFKATETTKAKIKSPAFIGHSTPQKNEYKSSYKIYELHNCEIDYGSASSGIGTLNNIEGSEPEYSIDILFDDIYETRYNEFMGIDFGDLVQIDLNNLNESAYGNYLKKHFDNQNQQTEMRKRLGDPVLPAEYQDEPNIMSLKELQNSLSISNLLGPEVDNFYPKGSGVKMPEPKKGALTEAVGNAVNKAAGQAISTVANPLKTAVKSAVLGNLYGFSLSDLAHNVGQLATGDVAGAAGNVVQDVRNLKDKKNKMNQGTPDNNIFPKVYERKRNLQESPINIAPVPESPTAVIEKNVIYEPSGYEAQNLYAGETPAVTTEVKNLGNIFASQNILNSVK